MVYSFTDKIASPGSVVDNIFWNDGKKSMAEKLNL
jgi:hypothetical protein